MASSNRPLTSSLDSCSRSSSSVRYLHASTWQNADHDSMRTRGVPGAWAGPGRDGLCSPASHPPPQPRGPGPAAIAPLQGLILRLLLASLVHICHGIEILTRKGLQVYHGDAAGRGGASAHSCPPGPRPSPPSRGHGSRHCPCHTDPVIIECMRACTAPILASARVLEAEQTSGMARLLASDPARSLLLLGPLPRGGTRDVLHMGLAHDNCHLAVTVISCCW